MKKKGASAVRDAIESAAIVPPPSLVPEHLAKRFRMLESGLHRQADDSLQWICDPFRIDAETTDEAGNWGILISWKDRDGLQREEVFARELFAGDCGELRQRFAKGGLTMMVDLKSRQDFAAYLNIASTPARARCVSRTGWHKIGAGRVFVLPKQIIGAAPGQRVILETSGRERAPFNAGGTLRDWRRSVAAVATGNSRLVFSVGCAFAGALLEMTGDDGGGFNLRGSSRVGKTTALRVAASVWGGEPGEGARAYIRTWRATGNALESIAALHSDTLLALDEIASVDAKELGEICYMLGNGAGKTRADRSGAMRAQTKFRVLFLSTGEVGLTDKNAEGKRATKAGQEVRFVDVAADAGTGLGIFEKLHDADSADAFAEELRMAVREQFGTAGPAFIEYVARESARDTEFQTKLRERIDDLTSEWLAAWPDSKGQVRSVAKRFALVAIAGELASEAEITGWAPGEATEACFSIFRAWLASRGTAGAREDAQAVAQLRDFINQHGDSRFSDWRKPLTKQEIEDKLQKAKNMRVTLKSEDEINMCDRNISDLEGDLKQLQSGVDMQEIPPHERFRTVNKAGWRRWQTDHLGRGSYTYFLTRGAMMEALTGLDFRASVKVLADRGYLQKDREGKSSVVRRPPGVEDNIRLFEVRSSIMGAGDDATE